jgi:hypothetical protein
LILLKNLNSPERVRTLANELLVPRDRESYLNEFIGLPERWTNFRVIVSLGFSRTQSNHVCAGPKYTNTRKWRTAFVGELVAWIWEMRFEYDSMPVHTVLR